MFRAVFFVIVVESPPKLIGDKVVQSLFGLFALTGIAWLLSENRRGVNTRLVGAGLAVQFVLAVVLLTAPPFKKFFLLLNQMVLVLESATTTGTSFVFGYLGGATLPFDEKFPGASFVLAFKALPIILVVSALSALFYYWKIIPVIVKVFSKALQKSMGIGGAAGLCCAANVFVGMVEAPLFIRPYLKSLTRSELFILMTAGMATIAGNMMVLYAMIIGKVLPDAMGHILTASIISAPAAIMVALVMIPETGEKTEGELTPPQNATSSMDAITKGATEGITLLLNIVAMLITLVALVSLVNAVLGLLPVVGGEAITLQRMLGFIMAPVTWLMGVPWSEAMTAGSLMGVKTVLNEFLAYIQMAALPEDALSERSRLIMTYAMCGFANFGSLGIMIGGLGAMAPDRREEIVGLGMKSIIAGTLATCLTGAMVGLLI